MLTIEQAAQRMGMKPHREVIAVVETADGDVVTTHDGNHTLIRPDGSMVFKVAAPVVAAPIAEPEIVVEADDEEPDPAPDEVDEAEPVVVKPAKRAKVKAAE